MTSKNSSLIDSGKFQKLLFRRRLWPAAMTGLIFFIYHILAPGLILNPNSHFNAFGIAADSQGLSLPQRYALDIFSDEGAFYLLITTGIAIVLAIQGFAWLDSRRQLDFYESQPVSRRQRFFGTVLNSFLIYAGCYLATLVPGLLIAAGNGAMSAHLPAGAFRRFGLALSLFAGVYGISVLAALLTGTVIFAVLGTFILLSAEAAYRILFSSYSQTFLTTWSTQWFTGKTFTMPFSWYTEDKFLPNLLIAAAALLLSWISFRLRKSESAGTTVVFAPVRLLVKTGIVLFVSLLAGLFGENLFSSSEFAAPVILILFFTALCCCIMEIIYAMSFRDLFRHPVQIAVYSAAALAIFVGFRLDLCGVNRYVPDASKVESCALLFEQNHYNNSFYVPETGDVSYDMQQYLEKNMVLGDVPAVLDLTRRGIEETVANADRDEDTGVFSRRINVEVLFRYKNGRKAWREFHVDAVQDATLLDAAFSSTDYKDARYFLNDTFFNGHASEIELTASNAWGSKNGTGGYAAFLDAYRRDLASFRFSDGGSAPLIGCVTADYDMKRANPDSWYSVYHQFPVFESFTNTLAYLRENGLWMDIPADLSGIQSVSVDIIDRDGNSDGGPREVTYKDPAQIRVICDSAVFVADNFPGGYYPEWMAETGDGSGIYAVTVRYMDGTTGSGSASGYFRKGSVPGFAAADLK